MTPAEAQAVIRRVSMKGYFPRVTIRAGIDEFSKCFILMVHATPIDERIVKGLDDAFARGQRGADFAIVGDANPFTGNQILPVRRIRVETTKVEFRRPIEITYLATLSEERFLKEFIGEALKGFAEHEIEEFFRVDGRRVFNPHPEVPGYNDK